MRPSYELPENFDWRPLAPAIELASDAVVRLDERLRKHPLAEGWAARMHFHEACASMAAGGELVHLEDVVLTDAMTNVRLATPDVLGAMAVLRVRRALGRETPGWAMSEEGLRSLRERVALGTPDFIADEAEEKTRFTRWRSVVRETATLPAVLAAAIAYDAWLTLAPFDRGGWLGRQLVAVDLQRRGKAQHHLPALSLGLRQAGVSLTAYPRLKREARLAEWLRAIEAGAVFGVKELDRLVLARAMMQHRLEGRRSSSHLPQLVALFMRVPLVTVPMAAKVLRISQQAANRGIKQLSPSIREMTDRGRYRAWSI